MEVEHIKGIIESLLFAAGDEGLSIKQIVHALEMDEVDVQKILEDLKEDYNLNSMRGITIVELAGTFQLATKKENSSYIKKLVELPSVATLSQAALETLAIIAYKQPITRAEIEEIRGVKTERPLHTLSAKALIKEVGRAEGTGRAYLYGTTKEFLDYFGLKNIDELPQLSEKSNDAASMQEEADLFFKKFPETMEF